MIYKVKLRFGSYSLHNVGNFEVGQEVAVSEDVFNYLKTVTAHVEDRHFPYFDAWTEEEPVKEEIVGEEVVEDKTVEIEENPASAPKTTPEKEVKKSKK